MQPEEVNLEDLVKKQISATADSDIQAARLRVREQEAKEATARYKRMCERVAAEERIIDDFKAHLEETFAAEKFKIVIPPVRKAKAACQTEEEAVLVLSDSHVGKIVEPDQTLGFGDYNLKKFFDRLYFLEETVSRMIQNNIHNPVRRLHVLFLGDLIEGALGHASEVPMRELVADQVLIASTAFYQFLARLSRVVPITVRGLGGNHARWMDQKKVPTENRYSNFDYIVLGQVEALVNHSKIDNIDMILEENPFQVFDIFDWRFKIGHGDHLKGGDKALGVPAHSMAREINATTQRYAARGEKPPDYYIVGDKHKHISVQTATGRYMVNGAFFDCCGYAMTANFSPGRPFQMFFGVHPKVGKSWNYDLALDMAKPVPLQYSLPARLAEKVNSY